jgi:hypothetical protein
LRMASDMAFRIAFRIAFEDSADAADADIA